MIGPNRYLQRFVAGFDYGVVAEVPGTTGREG
jgi:hypothetical protein